MTSPERFPVMWPIRRDESEPYERLSCPRALPWHLVEPARAQAERNHSQTLERLADRGGLSAVELAFALRGQGLAAIFAGNFDRDECIRYLVELAGSSTEGAP